MDAFYTQVWAIDRKKFLFSVKYRRDFVKMLRSYRFGEVISSVYSRDYCADRLVKLADAEHKIGSHGCLSFNMTRWQRYWRNRWFTNLVKCSVPRAMEPLN